MSAIKGNQIMLTGASVWHLGKWCKPIGCPSMFGNMST